MINRSSISAVEHKLHAAKRHFMYKYNIEPNSIIMSRTVWKDFEQFATTEDKEEVRKEYIKLYNTGIYQTLGIDLPSISNFNKLQGLNVILIDGPDELIQVCLI